MSTETSNEPSIENIIKDQITNNPIILYMKGNPDAPECGFSAQTVQILMACGQKFAFVDILSNPDIRANLPKVSDWPTFPQLFVDGELVGGCDIMNDMYHNGELKTLLDESAAKRVEDPKNGEEGAKEEVKEEQT